MSTSASAQVVRQALNKVAELNPQHPPVSKIHSNPDILLRKSQMDGLKGRFSISQVQPLNFSSGYFSASTVASYLDFNLTNINEVAFLSSASTLSCRWIRHWTFESQQQQRPD